MNKSWTETLTELEKLLCPPGEGVYTVHTAADKRKGVQEKLYPNAGNIRQAWKDSLVGIPLDLAPLLIGVASDCGGGILRGANWGPLFLRQKLLENTHGETPFTDLGDIRVIPHLLHDKYLNQNTLKHCRQALYLNENSKLPVSPLSITEHVLDLVYEIFPHKTIMGLGGDHSVSYPLVKAWLKSKKNQGIKAAIIHFDAHTDLLQSRLGVDLCFGSWAYHILPELVDPSHMIQLGIRSSGKDRGHWENQFNLKQYWSDEILVDPKKIAEEIIKHLKEQGIQELYISFDIDAIDQKYVAATGTPEEGGLTPHEPMLILQELHDHFKVTGADLVEVAPMTNTSSTEPESTLSVANTFVCFLLQAMSASDAH